MKYKLIAFDLDGTLLRDLHSISDENYAALKMLFEMGVVLVPTTGRSLYEIPETVRNCPYFGYAITSGGACTYDLKTGKTISSALLSKKESNILFDLLDEYDNVTMTHYEGDSYVDITQNEEFYDRCRVTKGFKAFIPIYDVAVDSFREKCKKMDGVELTCTFFATDEDKEEFKRRVKASGNFTVAASARDNLEVLSGKADKGVTVLELAASLGISADETIGVGDSINDLAMLKAVGLGIAMENAVPQLKEVADKIGCKCTEHIAKDILKNYF